MKSKKRQKSYEHTDSDLQTEKDENAANRVIAATLSKKGKNARSFVPKFWLFLMVFAVAILLVGCSQNATKNASRNGTGITGNVVDNTGNRTNTSNATNATNGSIIIGSQNQTNGTNQSNRTNQNGSIYVDTDGNRVQFTNSSKVNNAYFTLIPNTRYTFTGQVDNRDARLIFTVLNDTQRIDNVTTAIVTEEQYNPSNKVVKNVTHFYAQDNEGNVWHFGQISREYNNNEELMERNNTTSKSWIAGSNYAMPYIMLGKNVTTDWTNENSFDRTRILSVNESVNTPYRNFNNNCIRVKVGKTTTSQNIEYFCTGIHFIAMISNPAGENNLTLQRVQNNVELNTTNWNYTYYGDEDLNVGDTSNSGTLSNRNNTSNNTQNRNNTNIDNDDDESDED